MIKNIVFDMGWVLLEFKPEEYLSRYFTDEKDAALVNKEFFCGPEWPETDRGTISDADFIQKVCARLPERLHAGAGLLWQHWFEYLKPIEATNQLAQELKKQGYRIYLLSNTSDKFHIFRSRIPAIKLFDGTFISADVHFNKPEHEIYELFFKKYQLSPEECFFIDDRTDNIVAGEHFGMHGFCYAQDVEALKSALRADGVRI